MSGVSRGRALVHALLALAVGAASYVLAVHTGFGQRAEQNVLGASEFNLDSSPLLRLVSTPNLIVALVIIGAIAWMFRGFSRALWIVLFGAAAVLASQLLKHQWLIRPSLMDFDAPNTFPSGHMTVFTVVVAGLIWAVPASARGVVAVGGAGLLGAVSWQLLSFGWHRPSDVLGALALGVLAFALAAALRLPYRGHTIRMPRGGAVALNRVLGALLTVAGWALILGGLVLLAVAGSMHSGSLLLGGSEIALVGASAIAARSLMTLGA